MKLTDVVKQIQLVLPKFTDLFSNNQSIFSISTAGGIATITTTMAHGLTTGDGVTITNVAFKNPIVSMVKSGLVYTITLLSNHDLTFGYVGYENVVLSGFTDSLWNASFKLLSVVDRKTFTIQSTVADPVLNTNEVLNEVRIDGVNGRFGVTVVNSTTFTISGITLSGIFQNGLIKSGVRIAGTTTIARGINQYSEQATNDLWCFVVMHNATASKNRESMNDSQATIASGEDIRTRILDGFSVFLIKNVKTEIAGVLAMDVARHDLLAPITKSLFGARFPTGLSGAGDFGVILVGHNYVEVDSSRSTFLYEYSFQFVYDLTGDDSVMEQDTRAFQEIDFTQQIGTTDTENLTASNIDLTK